MRSGPQLGFGIQHDPLFYNNLPPLTDTAGSFTVSPAPSVGNGPVAIQFTSNNSGKLNLLELYLYSDPTNTGGQATVQILNDAGNSPGTVVATVGTINDTALTDIFEVVPVTVNLSLSPNTKYWLQLVDTSSAPAPTGPYGGSSINWSVSFNMIGTGVISSWIYANLIVYPVLNSQAFNPDAPTNDNGMMARLGAV